MSSIETTSPSTRPLRADAKRNRERILAAAKAAFTASGAGVQIDDIAAAAGVGVGTVYRHFPTKEVLVDHLIRQHFEGFCASGMAALGDPDADDGELLFDFLRESAEACAGDVGIQHLFQMASDPRTGAAMAADTGLLAIAGELIARGQRAGTVRPDFAAQDVGMIMCGVGGVIGTRDPAWDWRHYFAIILDGVRARP